MQVILAPHHDDALLSLADRLLEAGAASRLVLVVVFSDECPDLERVCERLHRALGFAPVLLGLPEARRRGLSLRAILNPRRGRPDGDPLVDTIADRAAAALAGRGAAALLAPLTRTHLDHALVGLAAEGLAARLGLPLWLYEDLPYALLGRDRPVRRDRLPNRRPVAPARLRGLLDPLRPFLAGRDVERILAHVASTVPDPA